MRGPSEQVGNVTEEDVPAAAVTGAAAPAEPEPTAHLNLTDHVAEGMNAELARTVAVAGRTLEEVGPSPLQGVMSSRKVAQ